MRKTGLSLNCLTAAMRYRAPRLTPGLNDEQDVNTLGWKGGIYMEQPVELLPNLFFYRCTCHVYVLKRKEKAVLIDFGDGSVLDHLAALGISAVEAILMTHHHRDQGQGLPAAALRGIPIYVPHAERNLFGNV